MFILCNHRAWHVRNTYFVCSVWVMKLNIHISTVYKTPLFGEQKLGNTDILWSGGFRW